MFSSRRSDRESRALHTVTKTIPDLLRASPRANHGIAQTEIFADPTQNAKASAGPPADSRTDLKIRLQNIDPLQVAARLSDRPYVANKSSTQTPRSLSAGSNVTLHNMASLTRPGGGFLTGANSQEEFLCARSTLFASLFHDYYPLPEFGGIFSPDVLVFRDVNAIDVPKRDRFFVNVISAGVPRHPDARGRIEDQQEAACSCGVSYCDRDRDIVTRKMKAVLRIAQQKGTKQLILGAWGCGGVGNHPVKEVAKLWRKILKGGARQRRPNAEQWEGIEEVIFAVPNGDHAREFRKAFEDVLEPEEDLLEYASDVEEEQDADEGFVFGGATQKKASSPSSAGIMDLTALMATASSLQLQIEQTRNAFLRNRLRDDLHAVNTRLAHAEASRRSDRHQPQHPLDFACSSTETDEDIEDDYVVSGFVASDGEEYSRFDPSSSATSDNDDDSHRKPGTRSARSAEYEFRYGANGKNLSPCQSSRPGSYPGHDQCPCTCQSTTTDDDEEDEEDDEDYYHAIASFNPRLPPQFDSATGWFHGSIDALMSAHHIVAGGKGGGATLGYATGLYAGRRKLSFSEGAISAESPEGDVAAADVLDVAAGRLQRN